MRSNRFASLSVLLGAVMLCAGGKAQAEERMISGAGATFPYPVYSQWADAYYKQFGTKLNYQSIGSGGGIAQIKARTVDFGASDAPMKKEELDQLGLMQWPMIMGGVVPVVNLEGIAPGQLKLTPGLLADIYLGKLTEWNDPAIAQVNPELKLPARPIVVVHRADGSGTTWIFTNYLDKVSPEWHEKVGTDKAVAWPTGLGGKGNEGVAAYVQRVSGGIGYVEFAYAIQNKMNYAQLQNRAGQFVAPTTETFIAAAANADWANAPGFYLVLTDQPGDQSWPITGASFILFYKDQRNAATGAEVIRFFAWCYHSGQEMADKLAYVPMPENVVKMVEMRWRQDVGAAGKPIWP